MINEKWNNREHKAVKSVASLYQGCLPEDVSELGCRVLIILDMLWGIPNISVSQLRKVDWQRLDVIQLAYCGDLSNFDNEDIARIFVLCGLAMVRVNIAPCNMEHVYIRFSLRETRDDSSGWHKMMPHPVKQVEEVIKNGHFFHRNCERPYDDTSEENYEQI